MILNITVETNEKAFIPDFESIFFDSNGETREIINDLSNLPNVVDNSVTTDKETLILHNMRLVKYVVNCYNNLDIDRDDLMSIGTIGLIKAVDTYESNKDIKLSTYAYRCIHNEIRMYLRKNNKTKNEISIEEFVFTDDDGDEKIFSDIFKIDRNIAYHDIIQIIDYKLLHLAIDTLSDKEKTLIELRYGFRGNPYSQQEVSKIFNVSQSYLSRVERKTLKKLKKELINIGY